MRSAAWTAALLTAIVTVSTAAEIDPEAVRNLEAAYPEAPAGRERKVVLLPHVDRGADDDLQVEIVVGRVIETDGVNHYRFG